MKLRYVALVLATISVASCGSGARSGAPEDGGGGGAMDAGRDGPSDLAVDAAVDAGSDLADAGGTTDGAPADGPADAATPSCAPPSPNDSWGGAIFFMQRTLLSVTQLWMISSIDGWLVIDNNQLMHWDGTSWTGGVAGSLTYNSIWASGPGDLWLATASGLQRRFADVTPFPQGGTFMTVVWGRGPDDVWVARGAGAPAIFHWDGTAWTDRSPPPVAPFGGFSGTGAFGAAAFWGASSNDVWAAGEVSFPSGAVTSTAALMHWDGASWTLDPISTDPALAGHQLTAAWGSSAQNVWAVGGINGPVVLRYDGHSWQQVDDPLFAGAFTSVWGTCGADVWVGGTVAGLPSTGVLLHHDGVAWSRESLTSDTVNCISGVSADDFWVGGSTGGNGMAAHHSQ
jgi:hypothetical protein